LTKTPPPPSAFNAEVTASLDRVVARALQKDRELRYQSAADMRADLKRLRRESDVAHTPVGGVAAITDTAAHTAVAIPTAPAPAPPRPSRRAWMIGAPLATVGVLAAALLWQSTRAPALTSRDTVVLSDFVNRTGDAVFDDTLGEALALQLRQSPFLNLL